MGWNINGPSTIYAIRCTKNGKVYIGRTQNLERRIREHWLDLKRGYKRKMRDPSLQQDFDRYGEESFMVHILETDVPPDKVESREAFWIVEYDATNSKYGYNKLSGIKKLDFEVSATLPPNLSKPREC